jgi:hypothetical protein
MCLHVRKRKNLSRELLAAPRALGLSALGVTSVWLQLAVKVSVAGWRPGSWVRYSVDRGRESNLGLGGDS